ncbi:hypothetical protein MMC22_000606 [Lobaria immixta]|nr:hypothetical protein [Lobaria immixta]
MHGQWYQIPCLECKEPLGESYVESAVARRDFQKLKAVAARKALEAHPCFRACLAADCTSGQIHENIHTDIVICKSCGSKSCYNHGVPWHEGYTCDRYDDSHPDAVVLRTSEERLKALAKKCPGEGCNVLVEKDGGCDSMWCSLCRKSWTWSSVKFGGEETVLSQSEIPHPVVPQSAE